jgi:adenosylcobinamide-GDP ribazoletransferase
MKQIIHEFLLAFQFMTRIPIRGIPHRPGALARAARFFPLTGLAIGLAGAGIYRLLAAHVPPQVLGISLLVYLVLITGGLHEDGLADAADGFGGGWSKKEILLLMRDSRIGSYGAIALTISLLARYVLIINIPSLRLPRILIAATVLCRWTSLPLAFLLPYARAGEGLGGYVAGRMPLSSLLWATLFAAGSAAAVLGPESLWIWLITIVLTAASGRYYQRSIGGVTGDCFGATNQLTEIAIYCYGALRQ